MKKFTKFKLSGRENKVTTCESYVLCRVDDTNKCDTKWVAVFGNEKNSASVAIRLMAQLALCGQMIGESLLRAQEDLTQQELQELVEFAMDAIRKKEKEMQNA